MLCEQAECHRIQSCGDFVHSVAVHTKSFHVLSNPSDTFGFEISPEAWRPERFLSTAIDPGAIALIIA
jgi:hypothetical protein